MQGRVGSGLKLVMGPMILLAALTVAPSAIAASGTVDVTGPNLTVVAAPGAKDNLEISRPSQSRLQVTDFPSGVHSGSPIHAGASCAQTGTKQVSCVATGVKRIQVSAGDLPDRVVNSTGIPSALDGGAANDILIGGSAADTLTGGPAPDEDVVRRSPSDGRWDPGRVDHTVGQVAGGDLIRLTPVATDLLGSV